MATALMCRGRESSSRYNAARPYGPIVARPTGLSLPLLCL